MNVASLELCKELYELSGWKFKDGEPHWNEPFDDDDEPYVSTPYNDDGKLTVQGIICPAYDLGFLLRKLPQKCRVFKDGERYVASHNRVEDEGGHFYLESNTPEDAACLLAIKLFKQGVLTPTQSTKKEEV